MARVPIRRRILDSLRRSDGKALTTPQIADAIIAAKGYGHEAKHALIRRVRANLSYLLRKRRAVVKTGERLEAKWAIRHLTQS